MFEITGDDIAALNDEDLRTFVGRLCEAELRRRSLPSSAVSWGGNQTATDGGLDVRVALGAGTSIDGFVPKPNTDLAASVRDWSLGGRESRSVAEVRDLAVSRGIPHTRRRRGIHHGWHGYTAIRSCSRGLAVPRRSRNASSTTISTTNAAVFGAVGFELLIVAAVTAALGRSLTRGAALYVYASLLGATNRSTSVRRFKCSSSGHRNRRASG